MEVIQTVQAMQAHANGQRQGGRRLALVPTMGALHEAHLALVHEARKHANHVTVSIFINPTQFGPEEDFTCYPRTLDQDLEKLERAGGVDVVFAPSVDALYPDVSEGGMGLTWIAVEKLDAHLCGAYRPGHFRGVATVVTKLFNICKPHIAVFGLKDAQQFLVLRRTVYDLNIDIELVGLPIVREPDGLALSSRNQYLSETERQQAQVLSQAVAGARQQIEAGEQRSEVVVKAMRRRIAQAPDAHIQYAEIVDTQILQPVTRLESGQDVLAAIAVFLGTTRLIDNAFVRVP